MIVGHTPEVFRDHPGPEPDPKRDLVHDPDHGVIPDPEVDLTAAVQRGSGHVHLDWEQGHGHWLARPGVGPEPAAEWGRTPGRGRAPGHGEGQDRGRGHGLGHGHVLTHQWRGSFRDPDRDREVRIQNAGHPFHTVVGLALPSIPNDSIPRELEAGDFRETDPRLPCIAVLRDASPRKPTNHMDTMCQNQILIMLGV